MCCLERLKSLALVKEVQWQTLAQVRDWDDDVAPAFDEKSTSMGLYFLGPRVSAWGKTPQVDLRLHAMPYLSSPIELGDISVTIL